MRTKEGIGLNKIGNRGVESVIVDVTRSKSPVFITEERSRVWDKTTLDEQEIPERIRTKVCSRGSLLRRP